MGTKRALAPAVGEVVRRAQAGTMLDAFSGMCSVGEIVGDKRQIWSNDVQLFASEVARALFLSRDPPLSPLSCGDIHHNRFARQKKLLSRTFVRSISAEKQLLSVTSFNAFQKQLGTLRHALQNEIKKCALRSPHLFSTTYSGTYFGVNQAIEADAILTAVGAARAQRSISRDEARWCRVALGRALLKLSNSTGHFAQYLKPKSQNYRRYLALRRRSLWSEWLTSLADLSPIGAEIWRRKNRVFNQDSLSLIPRLARQEAEVSVIYADPPYTDDQYSRFYHLLDTMLLYDYPDVTGIGLYRPARFQTPFSIKSKAPTALLKLIEASAQTGADLILSYPTNGLAVKAGADVRAMLQKYFRRVEICHSLSHVHSTFGASKGAASAAATELIYLARSA